jgi:hypothetical protein
MVDDKKRLIEKRKYIRLPFETEVKYKIGGDKSGALETAKSNNISPEGLCLTLKKPIRKKAKLDIEITIQELPPFSIKGEVMWAKNINADGKKTMAGIKILDISNDQEGRFLLELCDKMVNELGKKYPNIKF